MSAEVVRSWAVLLSGLVLVISGLAASCSGGDDTDTPTGSTQVTETGPPAVGGVGVEAYPTAVVRAEGGYYPPAYDPTRADENRAADETIRQLPLFQKVEEKAGELAVSDN